MIYLLIIKYKKIILYIFSDQIVLYINYSLLNQYHLPIIRSSWHFENGLYLFLCSIFYIMTC